MTSLFFRAARSSAGQASGPRLAKVCGLVEPAALQHALTAGADLVGLVSFEPSPRHLTSENLIALAQLVARSNARSVLVTVDADRGSTDRLAAEASLDAVQLCGSEDPSEWRETPYAILRRLGVDERAHDELDRWASVAAGFVLDAPSSPGGSGEGVDLELALRLAAMAPALLAGGLHGASDALWDPRASIFVGFDASSRLESSPGVKDPGLVSQFVQSVKGVGPASQGNPA